MRRSLFWRSNVMKISKNKDVSLPIYVNHQQIEYLQQYKYLGCGLNNQLDYNQEVRARIEFARQGFIKMKTLFCNGSINIYFRCLLRCNVWSILLFGTDTLTLNITLMNKLEAFELWVYRRILKILWRTHTPNEHVLRRAEIYREVLNTVTYLGQLIIQEKMIEEKRVQIMAEDHQRLDRPWFNFFIKCRIGQKQICQCNPKINTTMSMSISRLSFGQT